MMISTNYRMQMEIINGSEIRITHDTGAYIDLLEIKVQLLSLCGLTIDEYSSYVDVDDVLAENHKSQLIIRAVSDDIDDFNILRWVANMHYLLSECCVFRGDHDVIVELY